MLQHMRDAGTRQIHAPKQTANVRFNPKATAGKAEAARQERGAIASLNHQKPLARAPFDERKRRKFEEKTARCHYAGGTTRAHLNGEARLINLHPKLGTRIESDTVSVRGSMATEH